MYWPAMCARFSGHCGYKWSEKATMIQIINFVSLFDGALLASMK
jgi:hypothetical protein